MDTKKHVNVVVINKAGKVGKSTISKHLVAPMLGADWIQVETFNDSGQGAKAKIAGRKFDYVAEAVLDATRSLCIDIGNSNYQASLKEMRDIWAAAGFKDTLLRWKMKPEVVHGEKKDIQPRVQARGGQAGH
jgi:hypothetical protein